MIYIIYIMTLIVFNFIQSHRNEQCSTSDYNIIRQ